MKHFNLFKKSLFAVITSAVFFTVHAQTARFQLIHNASDPILDTVDIYIDGNKFDNVNFKQATPILNASSATVRININHHTSTDSSDQVLARLNRNVAANSNTVMMVVGVANPTSFATNPNGFSTGVQLIAKTVTAWAAGNNRVQVNIFHGVTDAPGVDIISKPDALSGAMPTNLRYAQSNGGTQAIFLGNVPTYLEMRLTGTRSVIKAYGVDLTSLNQKFVTVFAAGFLNPSANQNGNEFGLYAVDTNGNVAKLNEATRIQLIHNAPDAALNRVDVYFNNIKAISGLTFRSATPFVTIKAENTLVRVSNAGLNDTLIMIPNIPFESGKSYIAMALGLKDTTNFAANPNGINRMFNIEGYDSMPEGSLVNNAFQYIVANGSPDAPALTFNRVSNQTTVLSGLNYSDLSSLRTDNSNYIFTISNSDKSVFNGSYLMNATSWLNQSGMIFTSGFYNTTGNPTNAATFKLMLALNNGTVIELPRLKNKLQIIHNSPDTLIRKVDLYANGIKIVNDLGFRNTTLGGSTDAYVPVRINLTKGDATDTTNALWSVSLLPDSNFNVAIAYGFTGPAYRPNPDGISSNFGVKLITPAKELSSFASPANEVTFFHGCNNLGKLNIQGFQEAVFVAKATPYAETYKYSPVKGNAGATYIIDKGDASGRGLFSSAVNLVGRTGLAGVMYASGISLDTSRRTQVFLDRFKKDSIVISINNVADNNLYLLDKNLLLGFYIAWSNGEVDSFETLLSRTSINNINKTNYNLNLYPNPATDKVNMVLNANQVQDATISLHAINGALLKTITSQLFLGSNEIEISIAELPKGIYFIQVSTSDGTITKKLIIE